MRGLLNGAAWEKHAQKQGIMLTLLHGRKSRKKRDALGSFLTVGILVKGRRDPKCPPLVISIFVKGKTDIYVLPQIRISPSVYLSTSIPS